MSNQDRRVLLSAAALLGAAGLACAQSLNEHFDAVDPVTGVAAPGWVVVNHSEPLGVATYYPGDLTRFGPQATIGYLAVDFQSGDTSSTISNWQITPPLLLQNGQTLAFYTRTVDNPLFADRLQVRLAALDSTNVGVTSADVGDFTTLLLDINPTYVPVAYPSVWTQYALTLGGLPAGGVTGRLAFRYFVEDGGLLGTNSEYIGIDEAVYPAVVGACCRPDATCFLSSAANCTALQDVYHGDGTDCSSVSCAPPTVGACCLPDGTCAVVPSYQCLPGTGTFAGANTTCIQANCGPACYTAGGVNVPIPDGGNPTNGSAGADAVATLNIGDHGTITGLTAKVQISHSYQGDVRFRLVHPDGTSVDLVNRPGVAPPKQGASSGFGFATANFGSATASMVFRDGAGGRYDDAVGFPGPPPGAAAATNNVTGVWIATGGPLAAFNSKDVFGAWKLIANDYAAGDVGTIVSFSVCVTLRPSSCYANCDGSTVQPCLTVLDFGCFLNHFAAGDSYANCDGSTIPPVLTILDFGCFLNQFAAGCSSC